jgi:hypothetical protein
MLRIVVSLFAIVANALHFDEKGKNEWMLENIGEVKDVVFVGSAQSYMLSDDNLLTYFADTKQKSTWRKDLPTLTGETY